MAAPSQIFALRGGIGGRSPLPQFAGNGERRPAAPWPENMLAEQAAGRDAAHRQALTSFVELQVVPRLGLHRPQRPLTLNADAKSGAKAGASALADSVAAFVPLLLHRNIDDALSFMSAAQNRGQSIESLYLGLLSSTARHCGRLWEDDLMSFADVSIVAARLHQLLHITGPGGLEAPCGTDGRDIMLLAQPGAQHMLGLSMVRAFFRQAGWRVCLATPDTTRDMVAIMRENWFAVAGFAVTLPGQLGAIRAGIAAVRRASCNRRIGIIVGGPVLVEHPEYASQLDADSVALDGEAAVKQAEDLLVVPTRHV